MSGVAGILLAAGSSHRFGTDKQSTLIGQVPMLTRAACVLLDAGFDMPIVVLGSRAAEHRPLLHGLPLRVVENRVAASGMASSLVTGLDAADDCDAVVVTVCDQPAVTEAHLRALVLAWRKTRRSIVASSYAGTLGVPALFAATHFAELRELSGDRGAGPVLARHAKSVYAIPLPGGELDIDTPADLTRLGALKIAEGEKFIPS
jgi:molybdenum cofactor cytidylyltransferase